LAGSGHFNSFHPILKTPRRRFVFYSRTIPSGELEFLIFSSVAIVTGYGLDDQRGREFESR
jgi:hypothetical protein